jgi:hypothetical protein
MHGLWSNGGKNLCLVSASSPALFIAESATGNSEISSRPWNVGAVM